MHAASPLRTPDTQHQTQHHSKSLQLSPSPQTYPHRIQKNMAQSKNTSEIVQGKGRRRNPSRALLLLLRILTVIQTLVENKPGFCAPGNSSPSPTFRSFPNSFLFFFMPCIQMAPVATGYSPRLRSVMKVLMLHRAWGRRSSFLGRIVRIPDRNVLYRDAALQLLADLDPLSGREGLGAVIDVLAAGSAIVEYDKTYRSMGAPTARSMMSWGRTPMARETPKRTV